VLVFDFAELVVLAHPPRKVNNRHIIMAQSFFVTVFTPFY
jgi:hypothetical protein